MNSPKPRIPELLSPAGSLESAYTAFQYGADAVYLGLKQFSARAEAENFNLSQLSEITGFAHSQAPAKKIYLAINTLVIERELAEVLRVLATAADLGVDAAIVQDLGVARLIRTCFPWLRLHASTQMAIHNATGAHTLKQLGFARVICARELTAGEIKAIASIPDLEVETFIHGALCYSYSGLCLYSSLLRNRSGNRGTCTYPCRALFETKGPAEKTATKCFPFSMKDLALSQDLPDLVAGGVHSFKIEGRKKSPLYVAATTAFYRALLDGKLTADQFRQRQEELKTIFARPWTRLYVNNRKNRDVCDTEVVGHRGAPLGTVEQILNPRTTNARVRFFTSRALEKHDGLQIDLAEPGKPFGFPIDSLFTGAGRNQKEVIKAPPGTRVEVGLPPEHPAIPRGAVMYHASSQAIKRSYPVTCPKPGAYRVRHPLDITLFVSPAQIEAQARVTITTSGLVAQAVAQIAGAFEPSRNPDLARDAGQRSFEKLGETEFFLRQLTVRNEQSLFVPVSLLNDLRRQLVTQMEQAFPAQKAQRLTELKQHIEMSEPGSVSIPANPVWMIKTDDVMAMRSFTPEDWHAVSEVIVDIDRGDFPELEKGLAHIEAAIGKERIRLGLPLITRAHEEASLREKIQALAGKGYTRWEASNLSAWIFLREWAGQEVTDITCDWPLYALNSSSARQLLELGAQRFVLSPEDGVENMCAMIQQFPRQAVVVVYQDTPLFISETCSRANIHGSCKGQPDVCSDEDMLLTSSQPERLRLLQRGCRSILIHEKAFSLQPHLDTFRRSGCGFFRIDFIYRRYQPDETRDIWRSICRGAPLTHTKERPAHALS